MKPSSKPRIWIFICFCIVAGLLWCANWFLVCKYVTGGERQGEFGEMFGAVNALFTAFAFAGLIYTVLLQRNQLALQQQDIIESGETQKLLVDKQIDAQKELFKNQRKFQKEQAGLQVEHDIKMEKLRQDFEDVLEQRRKDRESERENIFRNNILRSIRCELEVVSDIYEKGIGSRLAKMKEGEIFLFRFALTEDWFTVFNASAAHLGRLDGELSRQIVSIYLLIKKLVEEYRINNEYLAHLSDAELKLRLDSNDFFLIETKKQFIALMQFEARQIKDADNALKGAVANFLADLDQRGIK